MAPTPTFPPGRACERTPLSGACLAANCDKRSYSHKLWRVGRQLAQKRSLIFEGGRPRVLMIHESMREPLRRGGVPDDCLYALPNPVAAWSETRIAAERNRDYLFVGRLDEEKGPDLAARAAQHARVPMTFIGDGPMLPALRAQYPGASVPWPIAAGTSGATGQERSRACYALALP